MRATRPDARCEDSSAKDTPEEAGFHETYKGESDHDGDPHGNLKDVFLQIVTNKFVWIMAAAYSCTGAVRHSSDQMAVMFFKEHLLIDMNSKPLSVLITMNLMTAAAVLGSVVAGIISDKVFKGARSPVAMGLYFTEAAVIACAAVAMFSGLAPGSCADTLITGVL